jgi:hypothetical protein
LGARNYAGTSVRIELDEDPCDVELHGLGGLRLLSVAVMQRWTRGVRVRNQCLRGSRRRAGDSHQYGARDSALCSGVRIRFAHSRDEGMRRGISAIAPVEGIDSCYDGERRRITRFQYLEQHRVTAVGQYGVRLRRPAKMYVGDVTYCYQNHPAV